MQRDQIEHKMFLSNKEMNELFKSNGGSISVSSPEYATCLRLSDEMDQLEEELLKLEDWSC